MYLSKLEIIGFKSFAQKVNLTFDSGISAIVGPNGCGKTNIVDAIRWVLGEQRYSALRSDKMEDVIFNGTKSRKALGLAEASLVIENTKGILPSEYTEVTVGRRVYRSGESEYLLNKVPCRLKDIQDLFMDTGMGADAYSVIELKMIETILSDKTDERRRLFEEAAGVTKYKHRRKAAYRKLESVQADLLRVHDIVTEVQKAVNSLERQARRAEQFNDVRSRLRAADIDLMEREFAQYLDRIRPLQEKLATLRQGGSSLDEGLAAEEHRIDGLRVTLLEAEKRLAEAQRDVSLHRERVHRVEEKKLVTAEQMKALRANGERLRTGLASLEQEQERLTAERSQIALRLEQLQAMRDGRESDLTERRGTLQRGEQELERVKAAAQEHNERVMALVQQIASRQTEVDRLTARIDVLSQRRDDAMREVDAYQQEIERRDVDITSLTAEDRQLRRTYSEAEVRYYEAEATQVALKKQIEDLAGREMRARGDMERHRARIDFVKHLIESREGLSEGARFLSGNPEWKPSRFLTVADVVHAEDRHRVAIEAALGEYASVILAPSRDDAERGISLLREHERGKATFVALDRLPRIHAPAKPPQIAGVHGWAVTLARFEKEYAPLFALLLDRVLVVDDAEAARRALVAFAGVRCVTLQGEMLTAVGLARGGSRRQDEGGMIGKEHQIEELESLVRAAEQELEEIQRSRSTVEQSIAAIDLKGLSEAVKSIEKETSAIEVRIAQLVFEKSRATDIIGKNNEDLATFEQETADVQGILSHEQPQLDAVRREKEDAEQGLAALTTSIAQLESEVAQRAQGVQDLGIDVATVGGEIQTGRNDVVRIDDALHKMADDRSRMGVELAAAEADLVTLEASIGAYDRELEALNADRLAAEQKTIAVEEESTTFRQEIHSHELRLKDHRREHDETLREAHELDLKVAELQAKADHLRARAQEEFEFGLALKEYPPGEFVDFASLRDEIQHLRDKLKSLGNINFAAFEEYQTEKDRLQFLTTQRNDLLEAEKTLLATIEEINATAQKKFLDTFALIRTNFVETFKSLFDPGDECDLRLEEEVDPLEARIEIVAKPRGKRPTSIDLLSGGEKTLTATALLFAIYLVKPSPFCILDEVDAPLDDANIDRFIRIIRKFSDNTQFIVVTHNKRTMEAANALYGITMEEEGVSKIVTVRFNQGAVISSAAMATG